MITLNDHLAEIAERGDIVETARQVHAAVRQALDDDLRFPEAMGESLPVLENADTPEKARKWMALFAAWLRLWPGHRKALSHTPMLANVSNALCSSN